MKCFISSDEIFDYLDSNWRIKLPKEFKEGNYDHDQAEIQRCQFKMSAIRKGYEFSKDDFKKLSILLSMNDMTEDVLELSRIFRLQEDLPKVLFDLYDNDNNFKKNVDSENLESVKSFINDFYHKKYGKMTDEIVERDSMFIIDESKKDKKRKDIIDSLL